MNAYEVLHLSPHSTKEELRKAYHALVRRWHPDRFQEGPERDWANEKMAQINAAYHACLHGEPVRGDAEADERSFRRIEELIDGGQLKLARRMLMGISTRCAEWNYLFGVLLMKLRDTHKALIYLRVAAHQQPENARYAEALEHAEREERRRELTALFHHTR